MSALSFSSFSGKVEGMGRRLIRTGTRFSLYTVIGLAKVPVTIGLNWLLIDRLKVNALLSTTVTVIAVFLLTYAAYVKTRFINPRFFAYASTTAIFNILTILLVWALVDGLGYTGAMSTALVVAFFFV